MLTRTAMTVKTKGTAHAMKIHSSRSSLMATS